MKVLIISLFFIIFIACQGDSQKQIKLTTQKDSVGYAIGMDIGKNLKQQEIDIDIDVLSQGIKDAVNNQQTLITEEQSREIMMEFQRELMAKHSDRQAKKAEKNKIEGENFLNENKKKEGVITTQSGLQYKILQAGKGVKPQSNQTVTVHYRGRLLDGSEFDNSYKRNSPATFPVDGVIRGWSEALQLMPVGSKWELYIPSELAYGENGMGQVIPPNATLIFEVELISVE